MENVMKYNYIRLETADNGVVLCYEVVAKAESHEGCYADCRTEYKKEVYGWDDVDKAVSKMKALVMYNKSKNEGSEMNEVVPHKNTY